MSIPGVYNCLRVMPVDLPDDYVEWDFQIALDEMDEHARSERLNNPFYVEFYKPQEQYRQ